MAGMLLPVVVLMLARHGRNRTIALGAAFAVGLMIYAFCSMPGRSELLPYWLGEGIIFLCISHSGFFWGFAIALFDDHAKIAGRMIIAIVLLEATYIAALLDPPNAATYSYLRSAVAIVLFVHPIYVAFRGRADDLIEARRTFRVLFVVLAGVYAIIQNIAETVFVGGMNIPTLGLMNIASIWILTLFLVTKLITVRPEQFFVLSQDGPPAVALDKGLQVAPANQALYGSLIKHLDDDGGYREPGLTITGLANQLGTQEHRLRRLINQELGFRNFRDFMNGYRLREVRARLSDPAEAHIPVLTIALDAGFQSLGPFNRAFKETEGRTPTEFRASALKAAAQSDQES